MLESDSVAESHQAYGLVPVLMVGTWEQTRVCSDLLLPYLRTESQKQAEPQSHQYALQKKTQYAADKQSFKIFWLLPILISMCLHSGQFSNITRGSIRGSILHILNAAATITNRSKLCTHMYQKYHIIITDSCYNRFLKDQCSLILILLNHYSQEFN